MRVNVSTVMSTCFQQVDPQAVEPWPGAPSKLSGECAGLLGQQPRKIREGGVALW